MGFASTICFPVKPIVDKEIGDFVEDFEQDSVVEQHDGDVDDGMMSDGNGGVMLLWSIFAMVCLCVGLLWNIVWQLVSVFSFSPFSRMQDRR